MSSPAQIRETSNHGENRKRKRNRAKLGKKDESKADTNWEEFFHIVSIISNKAKESFHKVGLAVIDMRTTEVHVSQFTENNNSYNNLVNMLLLYCPNHIILPSLSAESKLLTILKSEYPNCKISHMSRKLFCETKGHVLIKQLVTKEHSSVESETSKKYLCVSALAALFQSIELMQGMVYAANSLKIMFKPCSGYLLIDSASVLNLEIVSNLKSGKKNDTLFSAVNYTKTPMGARLLRANLLQPLTDPITIGTRLDCVEEILSNETIFFKLSSSLSEFMDIDTLLGNFVHFPKKSSSLAQSRITNIIYLKKTIFQLISLRETLVEFKNPLFKVIVENLGHEHLGLISNDISSLIDEDVTACRSHLYMQMQKCFAVRPGVNGLLDVARRQYTETVEDIHNLVKSYADRTSIPSIKLQYNSRRGYFISLDSKTKLTRETKKLFIQIVVQKKKIICSTEEINSLNNRVKDILEEIYMITENLIDDLVKNIRKYIGCLFKVSESVALLDMLYSFATLVSIGHEYVRPEFTKDGPIAVKKGRHPVIESRIKTYIPNDIYLSESTNFQIFSGPNMSGKTSYLKQVAILAILSHTGCFVPAKYATFRVIDRVFTRMGNDDSVESNSGSFMVEMKEMAYIIQNATNKSLILIDELGRGTSHVEGSGIAWSVSEYLLSLKAYTIFVTHFVQLADLEVLYPNVKNYHLMVQTLDGKLDFIHSIGEGSCHEDHYGIKLAKAVGFPEEIIEEAEKTCSLMVEHKRQKAVNHPSHSHKNDIMRQSHHLAHRLLSLKNSSLDISALKLYLQNLQKTFNELEHKL